MQVSKKDNGWTDGQMVLTHGDKVINQHGSLSPAMMHVPPERAACVPHWTCRAAASAELQLSAH